MITYLYIFIGGGLGSLSRYGMSKWFQSMEIASFWSTFTVNVLGSLIIGCAFALLQSQSISPKVSLFATMGFLGGFTTFSAFSLDSLRLIENGQLGIAIGYIALTVSVGLIATIIGYMIFKEMLIPLS